MKILKRAQEYADEFRRLDARADKLAGQSRTLKAVGTVGNVFTAVDIEADSVQVLAEYQFTGQALWSQIRLYALPRLLAAPPTSEIYRATLDTRLVPFDSRPVVLRLRTIEIPRHVSLIQRVASYLVTVGRVTPQRPQLTSSADDVEFATVTVGDTVQASLHLQISRILLFHSSLLDG